MTRVAASADGGGGGGGHPLVERIARLRGRVRLVLALHGMGLVAATAVAGFMLLVAGDYFLHFYLQTRLVLLIAGAVVLAVLAFRTLVRPLSTRLTDQFLASRVENVNKDLADELISAVHFVKTGTVLSNALAARHVDAASAKAAGLRFEDAIDFRMAGKALAAASVLAAVVTLVAVLNPGLTRIVFGRLVALDPNAAWPRTTTVQFDWGTADGRAPAVLPIGEQFTVQARVVRGGYAGQRVWLSSYTDTQPKTARELMTYQKEQSGKGIYVYERAIEPVGTSALNVWLEAGDQTDMEPVRIRLAPRPVIGELTASIAPPAYVKNAPAVLVDLLGQAGRAVEGSRVTLRIKASKPLLAGAGGRPDVRFLDQTKDVEVPLSEMSAKLLAPDVAEVSFAAKQSLQVRAMVRDTDGFENRVGGTMSLEVVPDALPSVVIIDPRRSVERSPGATVEITGQGTDDLGLDGAKLVAERFDAKPGDPPVFSADLKWRDVMVDAAAGVTTGRLSYAWDLGPLALAAGTRLSFYLMVQDNYEVARSAGGPVVARPFMLSEQGTIRHEWVKSAPLSLQIRSEAEIAERNRKDLNEIKERIVNLKGQQEETKDKTEAINKAVSASGVSTPQQKEQLGDLAQQQSQQASSANAIQQRVEQIKEDLRQNRMDQTDLGKLAAEVSAGMKDVGQNNMPKAASELSKAQDAAGLTKPETAPNGEKKDPKQAAEQTKDATGNAGRQQQEAITKMENMIAKLGTAGDFEAIRQKTREILDQQTALTRKTRETMAPNVGKNPEELSKEAKEKQDSLAGQQKDLSDQTAALTEQMNKTAQQMQQSDPATSASLSKAAEASDANKVSPSQKDASGAMGANQLSIASNNQQQAQRGLQQMLDELDKQSQRQLEQLSRQLADLLKQLKERRDEETHISKETTDLGDKQDKKAFLTLGDEQGRTHQNTIVNQKRAESTRDAQRAAADVRDAAEAMGNAAGALYAARLSAIEPEMAAIKSLEEAIRKLEEQKKKVDDQLKDKDLAEFIRQYEGIRKGQEDVKVGADRIETARQAAEDQQIDRAGLLELSKYSVAQNGLAEQVRKLSADEKLKEYEVIIWMNGQIVEYMQTSRERMSKAQTGPALAAAQQTAIDRITDIINALKEEKEKPDPFAGGGGGGGGGGGKPPLVPPVAQLKLLKAMQKVVNNQTVTVDKAVRGAAGEADRVELGTEAAKLGRQQGEIKEMASKVMEKLSGGQ